MTGKVIKFYLDEDEVKQLISVAMRECRDMHRQAHWIVRQALILESMKSPVASDESNVPPLESDDA